LISAAAFFSAAQTPSVLRNTSVSLPLPSAAVATTKPTVALSGSCLQELMATQNVSDMVAWSSGWDGAGLRSTED